MAQHVDVRLPDLLVMLADCPKCPCWSRVSGGPFSLIADKGVGENKELSHDRHDGDLGGFPGFDEGLILGLEFRVESDSVEGGHIESLSGSWTPAADGSHSMGLAAVPWDRRETYEAGGLGVLETPELGRLDDEHVCSHLANAWNARQDVEPLAQVRICVAQCFEASIDRFDLAVDLAQPLSELTFDLGEPARIDAVSTGFEEALHEVQSEE